MMQRHYTASLVGPFSRPESAIARVTMAMAVDFMHPTDASSRSTRVVTTLGCGSRYWVDLGAADRVVARLLLDVPDLRAYRCTLESGSGKDCEWRCSFAAELSKLVAEPGRSVPRAVDITRLDHPTSTGTRPEDAWLLAARFLDAHECLERLGPVEPIERRGFDVRSDGVRPSLVRARRALADAAELACVRVAASWELRMTMVDGSRRLLVLDEADWAALDLRDDADT